LVNSAGVTDFDNGLTPDVDFPEDYSNLGVLGDPSEPLLAKALEEITGVPAPVREPALSRKTIWDSKSGSAAYQLMWEEHRSGN
jgi:hypothetical protein